MKDVEFQGAIAQLKNIVDALIQGNMSLGARVAVLEAQLAEANQKAGQPEAK